jgi:cupin fold WbuC family metalloprotein
MKTFDAEYMDGLTDKARRNPCGRQHRNIHESYEDACQRLFNAIEPGSYIRPHRHASDPRDELLIAVRGALALVTFDDRGTVTCILRFGTEKHGANLAVGAELLAAVGIP